MKAIVHIGSGSGDPHLVPFRVETGTRPVTYVDDGLSATALRPARGAVFFSDYDNRRIRTPRVKVEIELAGCHARNQRSVIKRSLLLRINGPEARAQPTSADDGRSKHDEINHDHVVSGVYNGIAHLHIHYR